MFGLTSVEMKLLFKAALALILFNSSVIAEIVRGGLNGCRVRAFCPRFGEIFCVREEMFFENAAKLQKKLQFSHQKRRFPIDSLVIIGV